MSNPTVRPGTGLSPEIRCFVQWLETHGLGEPNPPARLQERVRAFCDSERGGDRGTLWNELFGDLFDRWVATVRQAASGEDLDGIVQAVLGRQEEESPEAAASLKRQLAGLRAKIAEARGEDEEFEPDLSAMDQSLATYEQVIDQFGDEPRLDEVVRRGVKQALAAKQRDFQWLEALLERLRSERAARANEAG